SGVRADSLPSKYDTTRPLGVTPSAWVSRRSRRVSSAATTSAAASSSASRGGASETSPMGAPASTTVPGTSPSSQCRPGAAGAAAYPPWAAPPPHGSLRWRGDQYRVLPGHPAGAGAARAAAVVAAAAAPFRLPGVGPQRRRPRPAGPAVHRAVGPAVVG